MGRCDGGRVNPQELKGRVTNAGQTGSWLMDCDRKMKGFLAETELRYWRGE